MILMFWTDPKSNSKILYKRGPYFQPSVSSALRKSATAVNSSEAGMIVVHHRHDLLQGSRFKGHNLRTQGPGVRERSAPNQAFPGSHQ